MQLPDLKKLNKDFKDELKIVGLNWGDRRASALYFMQKFDVPWFSGRANQKILNTLLVDGYPYYILVNKAGEILALNTHFEELRKIIR